MTLHPVPTGRRSSRRLAVFVLYQQDLLKLDAQTAVRRAEGLSDNEYATRIIQGVDAEKAVIDAQLSDHLSGWTLERLGILERSILRVAAYELIRESEVPVAVVVDEAVTLAGRFCSGEAAALVNGVLGNLAEVVRPQAAKHIDEGRQLT